MLEQQVAELFSSVSFRLDKPSVSLVESSFVKLEALAEKLKQTTASLTFKHLSASMGASSTRANTLATRLGALTAKFETGTGSLVTYTTAIESLAAAFLNLNASIGMQRLPRVPRISAGESFARGGTTSARASIGIGENGLYGFLRGGIGGLGATAGILGMGWGLKHAISTGREMQANQFALNAVAGSDQQGEAEYKYVYGLSQNLGINMKDALKNYSFMMAAAKGSKLEGHTQQIFTAFNEYGKMLHSTPQQLKLAMLAVNEMVSMGKVSLTQLRRQLSLHMPGALEAFAEARHESTEKLMAEIKKGKVMTADVLPRVAEILHQRTVGNQSFEEAKRSGWSAQQRVENMWDNFTKGFVVGIDPAVSRFFEALSRLFSSKNQNAAENFGKAIGRILDVITGIVNAIAKFKEMGGFGALEVGGILILSANLMKVLETIRAISVASKLAFVATTALSLGFKGIMEGILTFSRSAFFASGWGMLFLLLDDLATYLRGGKSVIGELIKSDRHLGGKVFDATHPYDPSSHAISAQQQEAEVGWRLLHGSAHTGAWTPQSAHEAAAAFLKKYPHFNEESYNMHWTGGTHTRGGVTGGWDFATAPVVNVHINGEYVDTEGYTDTRAGAYLGQVLQNAAHALMNNGGAGGRGRGH